MEKKSLSLAKISKPQLAKILPRRRLFRVLDRSRNYPAIWVTGPAGSGKTTLVASYIDDRDIPYLWYQIDQGDSDISTFFYFMGLAGKKAAPRRRKPLPLLTPEYASGIPTFTRRYFESLFDRLKKPGVLVLDNYQEVLTDSLFHEVIRDGLSVIPADINVFILSRTEPPPALAGTRAVNVLDIVGWNELRLKSEETHEVVRLLGQKEYPDEVIDQFHKKTDGWVAGLILLLKRTEIEDIELQFLSRFTPEDIFDYFASEVFENLNGETQSFLINTAILPRMTAKMARSISGQAGSEKILSRLNREQFFTDRNLGKKNIYRYHALFREFLLARANEIFKPSHLAQLKQQAASLLEADGYVEDAVALYQESDDLDNVTRLILNQAQTLVNQGRHKTLEHWITNLPHEMVENNPWLLYWLGASRMPFNPTESRLWFEKALSQFEDQQNADGILVSLSTILPSIAYAVDIYRPFDQWIPEVEKFRKEHTEFSFFENKALMTYSMLYAPLMRQPNHPSFPIWEKWALSLLEQDISIDLKIQLMLSLTYIRLTSGNLAEAELLLNSFRELAKSQNVIPLALITLGDLETYYFWLSATFEKCHIACTQTLELADETGVHALNFFIRGHGAAGALSTDDTARATVLLNEMESELSRGGTWAKVFFHVLSLWKALLQKDIFKAEFHADQALKYGQSVGMQQTFAIT